MTVEDLLFNGLEKRECTNDAQQLAEISQICVRESRKKFSLSTHPRAVAGRSEESE